MPKKNTPTPTQADALAAQRAGGDELRGWFQIKQRAGDILARPGRWLTTMRKVAEEAATPSAADRVPESIRNAPRQVLRFIAHGRAGADAATRRRRSVLTELPPLEPRSGPLEPMQLGVPRARAVRRRQLTRDVPPAVQRPYRNPDRAGRLARSGRLRKDLP